VFELMMPTTSVEADTGQNMEPANTNPIMTDRKNAAASNLILCPYPKGPISAPLSYTLFHNCCEEFFVPSNQISVRWRFPFRDVSS
jgi:hypothetical protein